jgi:hypothetical protein
VFVSWFLFARPIAYGFESLARLIDARHRPGIATMSSNNGFNTLTLAACVPVKPAVSQLTILCRMTHP